MITLGDLITSWITRISAAQISILKVLWVKHTWPCLWVHIQCHFWKIYWNCNSWCTGWTTWVLFPTCIWKRQINWSSASSIMQEWQHLLTTNNLFPCASGILVTPLGFGKHPLFHCYSLSICSTCWKVSIANSDGKSWVWKLNVNRSVCTICIAGGLHLLFLVI